jgi:hypothetical protein
VRQYAQLYVDQPLSLAKLESAVEALRKRGVPEGASVSAVPWRAGITFRAAW